MRTSSEVEALTGLLDFYSDRAEAHASFMVACIFGLFTWLAIAHTMKNMRLVILSIIPYVLIAFLCYHNLQRFTFYSSMAVKYKEALEEIAKPKEMIIVVGEIDDLRKTNLEAYRIEQQEKLRGIPRKLLKQPYIKLAAIVLLVFPFAIVYLPKFVPDFFPNLVPI